MLVPIMELFASSVYDAPKDVHEVSALGQGVVGCPIMCQQFRVALSLGEAGQPLVLLVFFWPALQA
jgi:hypothetical protein